VTIERATFGDEHSADVFTAREFPFTPRDFRLIASMLREDAGIALAEMKAPLVYSRLVKRLRALGIESFKAYCDLIGSSEGADERAKMVAALTTNVTRFFREPHHFEHLKTRVLPPLLDDIRKGGCLRIWSAGCSSGEEPYSIALTILSLLRDAARLDVKVLATDINKDVLEVGQGGEYGESAVAPISPQQRDEWFTVSRNPEGQRVWRAGHDLRALVSFRELNLMERWPMRRSYQAIFCRNVAIYFEEQLRAQIWPRLGSLLAPKGCLYVGHSERVTDTARFQIEGYTTYRLLENGAPISATSNPAKPR
jgi:chemotaxis protein methyltransferase CheR